MAQKTYISLKKLSLRYRYYVYLDVSSYLADGLFAAHRIEVRYDEEFEKENTPYRIIICRVNKRDVAVFEEMLAILPERIVACGYEDYPDVAREIISHFEDKRG